MVRRLVLAIVLGLSVVALGEGAAEAVETIVVVDPPADGAEPGRGLALEQAEESTPVGFITGYVALTVLVLTVAVILRGGRSPLPGPSGHGSGIAYGRRSNADFWAHPVPARPDRPRRAVPG